MGGLSLWDVASYCMDRGFLEKLKLAVYDEYVKAAILYWSEVWCLKESEMAIFVLNREFYGEENVWCTA